MLGVVRVGQVVDVAGQDRQGFRDGPLREGVLLLVEEAHGQIVDDLSVGDLLELETLLVAVDLGIGVDRPREVDVCGVQRVTVKGRHCIGVGLGVDEGGMPEYALADLEGEDGAALNTLDVRLGNLDRHLQGSARRSGSHDPVVATVRDLTIVGAHQFLGGLALGHLALSLDLGIDGARPVPVTAGSLGIQHHQILRHKTVSQTRAVVVPLPVLDHQGLVHLAEEPASNSGVLDRVADVLRQAGQMNDHATAIEHLRVLVAIRVKDVLGRLTGPGNLDGRLVLADGWGRKNG